MNQLNEKINQFRNNQTTNDNIKISNESVKNLIDQLSNGKAIGFSWVSNEMIMEIRKYAYYK